MKLAIHHHPGSFSDRWIEYCKKNKLDYKIVNAHRSDIIEEVKGCDGFLWAHYQGSNKDVLIAKSILFALEETGIEVFPDFRSTWHFDDKTAQKYLLEAIAAPLVNTYVSFDKKEALVWAEKVSYPKVFKLKRGAGSSNVKLVRSRAEANKLINRAFGKGFRAIDPWRTWKESKYKKLKGLSFLTEKLRGLKRGIFLNESQKLVPREKGYVYFQDFIPNNDSDIRIIVVGDRAFGVKRLNREGDFRASGSGKIVFDRAAIDERCVKLGFEMNERLKTQSIAYDFVFDENDLPKIVEISYNFSVEFYDPCPGYWDKDLNWYEGQFNPQEWMIENLIEKIKSKG